MQNSGTFKHYNLFEGLLYVTYFTSLYRTSWPVQAATAPLRPLPSRLCWRCCYLAAPWQCSWKHSWNLCNNVVLWVYDVYIYIYTGYIYIYVCMFVSRISQEICKINYSIGWCLMWIILPSSTHFGFQECTLPGHMAIETSRFVVEAQFGQTNCLCFAAKSMVVCTSICP